MPLLFVKTFRRPYLKLTVSYFALGTRNLVINIMTLYRMLSDIMRTYELVTIQVLSVVSCHYRILEHDQ